MTLTMKSGHSADCVSDGIEFVKQKIEEGHENAVPVSLLP